MMVRLSVSRPKDGQRCRVRLIQYIGTSERLSEPCEYTYWTRTADGQAQWHRYGVPGGGPLNALSDDEWEPVDE